MLERRACITCASAIAFFQLIQEKICYILLYILYVIFIYIIHNKIYNALLQSPLMFLNKPALVHNPLRQSGLNIDCSSVFQEGCGLNVDYFRSTLM